MKNIKEKIYKKVLEEIYEIAINPEDYEADLEEIAKKIKECELEVAKYD